MVIRKPISNRISALLHNFKAYYLTKSQNCLDGHQQYQFLLKSPRVFPYLFGFSLSAISTYSTSFISYCFFDLFLLLFVFVCTHKHHSIHFILKIAENSFLIILISTILSQLELPHIQHQS